MQYLTQAQQQTSAQIQQLQVEWNQARAQMNAPQPPVQPPVLETPARKPRPVLPDPDPYDGEDLALYPQFRGKLAAKLQIDGPAIGGTQELLWYAFSRLEGKAAARLLPWMTTFKSDLSAFTIPAFWEQLDAAFLDKAREQKALDRLNVLRQGTRTIDDLLRELDQLLLEAAGFEWSDVVKKGFLKAAINLTLRDRMITVDEKPTYMEYCAQVKTVADRLQECNRIRDKRKSYRGAAPAAPNETSAGEPMDWSYTVNKASGPRASYASHEEMERRRRERACLRCGKQGHYIANCDKAPVRRERPISRTPAPQQTKSTIAEVKNPPSYEDEACDTEEDLKG